MNESLSDTQWMLESPVPAALISYAYRATQRKFAKALSDYNIGWGHFAILMILDEKEGRSQDELALSRGFDKTMIAHSVKKLEELGLLYRVVDEQDKRIRRLYLTEYGKNVCPELRKIGFEINDSLTKNFSKTDKKNFMEYLRRLALNTSEM